LKHIDFIFTKIQYLKNKFVCIPKQLALSSGVGETLACQERVELENEITSTFLTTL